MENEIWKSIKGYEGYYEISNLGRVKSVERRVIQGNHTRFVKECIKKIHKGAYGYPSVTLCIGCKSRTIPIHRLLARAFIPNPENKPFIDHINTDKTDYRLENLRWVTPKENANNALTIKHSRERVYTKEVSEKINRTKIERRTKTAPKKVYQYTKEGVFIKEFSCSNVAESETSVNASSIRDVCKGKRFSAGGFLWRYEKENDIKCIKPQHPNSKPIFQFDRNMVLIKKWESVSEAARELGYNPANISRSAKCKNPRGKFIWRYKEML